MAEPRPIPQKTFAMLGERFSMFGKGSPRSSAPATPAPEAARVEPPAASEQPPQILPPQLDLWTSTGEAVSAKAAAVRAMKKQRLKPETIERFASDAAKLEARTEQERQDALVYTGRALILAGLPHSDPGDVPRWTRHNGNVTLQVEPRVFALPGREVKYGIPYGSFPRLLIPLIDSEIVRTKDSTDHRIFLGDSVAELHRLIESHRVGEPRTIRLRGGKRGQLQRYEEQTRRLATARFTLIYTGDKRGFGFKDLQIASAGFLCWDPIDLDQRGLFQSFLLPTEDYVQQVLAHPIPIDMSALLLFAKSPLQMDVFEWLCWRLFNLEKLVTIPWTALQMQFGTQYRDLKRFRFQFKAALDVVCSVYTKARVKPTPEGLQLQPSPTYVPKKIRPAPALPASSTARPAGVVW